MAKALKPKVGDPIFEGFDPLARYESPLPETKATVLRTQYSQDLMLRDHWSAFGMTTRITAGRIALRSGIPPWTQNGFRSLFQELAKHPEIRDLASDALRGVPQAVNDAMIDAIAAVPYVRLVVNLGLAISRLVRAATKAAEERGVVAAELIFSRAADEQSVDEVLLAAFEHDDWTTVFSPGPAGEWEWNDITWTIGGTNAQGRRFLPKRFELDKGGTGLLPGLSEQEGWYEYAFEVDAPFTLGVVSRWGTPVTTLGSTHPSVRQLSMTLWQAANKPSPQMFMLKPNAIIDAWEGYYASLAQFAHQYVGGHGRDAQMAFQAWKMCSASLIHKLMPAHTPTYPRARFSGLSKELLDEIRDPDPLHQRKGVIADMDGPRWPMSRLVRYLVLEQKARMRPTLGTIICAYVPSDAPALLDDPALMQYHNEMRVELLRHPARCEVDLELIPDPVYRNAMAAAQAQINCGAVMAAPGGPTPKGNRAPTVDPDAAPEPPGGDQGAPESEFGGTGGGAGVVEALMVGGGLAALWALFG